MNLKPYLLTLLFCVLFTFGYAQQEELWLNTALTKVKANARTTPVEKVYLHFDKPYYAAGDDIWFKAYVVAGADHYISLQSGLINVELIDNHGHITRSAKLMLNNGTAPGYLALPDTLAGGNYHIRAYTNYMRNAGSEYFFDQVISILSGKASRPLNPTIPSGAVSGNTNAAADVQFFPEGGYLVDGITSQVAFKATGPNGRGLDIKGTIIDTQNNQVALIKSAHLGTGKFQFTPKAGVKYSAKITTDKGSLLNISLPDVKPSGYALNVADMGSFFRITSTATTDILDDKTQDLTVMVRSSGSLYTAITGSFSGRPFVIDQPKSKLPEGIAQITLFNTTGEPVAERLAFVRRPDNLKLLINGPAAAAPRREVKFDITAASKNKPAGGSFSVSVVDETKVPVNQNMENNILAGLLLRSDLKGYIEQPAYYFNNENDKTRADLDALMLTQGYRRFIWQDIIQHNGEAYKFKPEKGLHVSGTITNTNNKPVAGAKIQLSAIGNINTLLDTISNARGHFEFNNLSFNDSVKLIMQALASNGDRDVQIHLDSISPPAVATNNIWPDMMLNLQDSLASYQNASDALYNMQRQYGIGNHAIALKEVTIREKKKNDPLKHSSNLLGPGNADQVLLMKDIGNLNCTTLADCLQGRLIGVVFKDKAPYSSRTRGMMQIILDGAAVDTSQINYINPNEIQAVEVLNNAGTAAIYGARGFSGVLIITTKRGDDAEDYTKPSQNLKVISPQGFYAERVFYSPKYAGQPQQDQLADLRTTIYWNPKLSTGTDGKASFQYFNAGSKGRYRITIEGIDNDGNIGRLVYRYNVSDN